MKLVSLALALVLLGCAGRDIGAPGRPLDAPNTVVDSIMRRDCLTPPDETGGCLLRDQGIIPFE